MEGLLFGGSAKLATLKNGDELILRRETQPYDVFGVSVLDKKEQLIGELSALDNEIFARLLDAGKKLSVKVKQVVILPEYNSLEVSISMIDF